MIYAYTYYLILFFDGDLLLSNKSFQQPWVKNIKSISCAELLFLEKVDAD
jgi:hypothetical protein